MTVVYGLPHPPKLIRHNWRRCAGKQQLVDIIGLTRLTVRPLRVQIVDALHSAHVVSPLIRP